MAYLFVVDLPPDLNEIQMACSTGVQTSLGFGMTLFLCVIDGKGIYIYIQVQYIVCVTGKKIHYS